MVGGMIRVLRVDGMLWAVGVLLIATAMLMTMVVVAVGVMVMLVTVLVSSMMGVVRGRRRGRGWRGSGHRWLPFFPTRLKTTTTQVLWLHEADAAHQVPICMAPQSSRSPGAR